MVHLLPELIVFPSGSLANSQTSSCDQGGRFFHQPVTTSSVKEKLSKLSGLMTTVQHQQYIFDEAHILRAE